jgi:TatD DNase family protein
VIDTHCHLDHEPLASDLEGVLARAMAAGVDRVVVPAVDTASWPRVKALTERTGVTGAFGLHPWSAEERLDLEALDAALDDAVAVGEIGLDTKIESPGLELQLEVFRRQLEVAVDRDLPVILHCRGAFPQLLDEIGRFGGTLRGVVHAFSRGPELAQQLVAAGMVLGIGGAVTRPRADRVRRAVRRVPLERLVLETDAPSIGLDGVPAEETEPRHVAAVAAALAEVLDQPVDHVAATTTTTAETLFDLT